MSSGVTLSCHVAAPHRACRWPWRDLHVSLMGSPWQVRSRCCPTSDASWRRWTRPSSSTPSPSSWATKRRSSASRGSSRSCWYWTRRRWSLAARGGWVGGREGMVGWREARGELTIDLNWPGPGFHVNMYEIGENLRKFEIFVSTISCKFWGDVSNDRRIAGQG